MLILYDILKNAIPGLFVITILYYFHGRIVCIEILQMDYYLLNYIDNPSEKNDAFSAEKYSITQRKVALFRADS